MPSPLVLYCRDLADEAPALQREALSVLDGGADGAGAVPPSWPLRDWGRASNYATAAAATESAASDDQPQAGAAADSPDDRPAQGQEDEHEQGQEGGHEQGQEHEQQHEHEEQPEPAMVLASVESLAERAPSIFPSFAGQALYALSGTLPLSGGEEGLRGNCEVSRHET